MHSPAQNKQLKSKRRISCNGVQVRLLNTDIQLRHLGDYFTGSEVSYTDAAVTINLVFSFGGARVNDIQDAASAGRANWAVGSCMTERF